MNITDLTHLEAILREHDIPIHTWGTGNTKTTNSLFREILRNESKLELLDGALVRRTRVACVDVFFRLGEKTLRLKEERQLMGDGRTRERNLETGVNEKLVGDEDPLLGAIRGLEEELGLTRPVGLRKVSRKDEPRDAISYPGLTTLFERHFFEIFLTEEQFRAEGYVEEESGKKTYFVWKETH